MRLAQVARNLSITTEDIVSFLAKRDINIIKDSNTKLDDTTLELIYANYGKPEVKTEIKAVEAQEEITEIKEAQTKEQDQEEPAIEASQTIENDATEGEEIIIAETKQEPEEKAAEAKQPTDSVTEDLEQENDSAKSKVPTEKRYRTVSDLLEEQESNTAEHEVDESEEIIIKAPKVNLQGLNILGKIDLPEPKEKKPVSTEEEDERPKRSSKGKNIGNRPPKRALNRNRRKELTPQEIRLREKKAAERKKQAEENERKRQREAFYKENVLKPQQQQQRKKQGKKKNEKSAVSQTKNPIKPAPKTALGKFWRWLNT